MPLYVASTEIECVIEAADEKAAERVADKYLKEEVTWNGIDGSWVTEIKKPFDVPIGWDDAVPYGGDGSTKVMRLLELREAEAPTTVELEEAGQQRLVP